MNTKWGDKMKEQRDIRHDLDHWRHIADQAAAGDKKGRQFVVAETVRGDYIVLTKNQCENYVYCTGKQDES